MTCVAVPDAAVAGDPRFAIADRVARSLAEIDVPTWNALGCRVLFHHGVSIGYRLTDNWSVMGTFAHISNGTLCSRNVGQNDYGVRLGYTF